MSALWITSISGAGSLILSLLVILSRKTFKMAQWIWLIFKQVEQFLEDFSGTPERPGVPARPGVLERLQLMEIDLAEVKAELNYDHGITVKDAVHRIDQNVLRLMRDLGE